MQFFTNISSESLLTVLFCFYFFLFLSVCVSVCKFHGMLIKVRNNFLKEPELFLRLVGPVNQAKVVRLGSRRLYPWSQLATPHRQGPQPQPPTPVLFRLHTLKVCYHSCPTPLPSPFPSPTPPARPQPGSVQKACLSSQQVDCEPQLCLDLVRRAQKLGRLGRGLSG